jgi:glycosyltransferase involved in cell wall biosynthesis
MHILAVTSYYYPEVKYGGPPMTIHALNRGLLHLGHQVEVVTVHSQQRKLNESANYDGVSVRYLPWVGWDTRHFPLWLAPLAGAVRRADVVHCYGLYNLLCPWAFHFARKTQRPCLLEPEGMFKPQLRNVAVKRLYHRVFTQRMLRQSACVIATALAEADTMKEFVPAEKLVVRPNGIDLEAFKNLPSGAGFRERFHLASQEKIVLFLGRISPVKNLDMLVQAFGMAQLTGWRLLLAGPVLEPDYALKLERLIRSLQLKHPVIMTGPVYGQDKLEALAAADLVVLPSFSESFGNAAAEAIAAGVPVLVTDGCGIAPIVHGRAGLAVRCETAALAAGLRRLCDPAERASLVARRPEVLPELSWEKPMAQMDQIYRRRARRPS